MKHLRLLTILLALGCSLPCAAQAPRKTAPRKPSTTTETTMPRNVLKINPLSLFVLTLNGSYERVINAQMSGQLGIFYTVPAVTIAATKFRGFGITPEFRYYFLATEAPKGFYVGPFVRYQRFVLTYDDPNSNQYDGEATFQAVGGGALVGGQWLLGNRISVDAFVGLTGNSFRLRSDVPGLTDKIRVPIAGAVSPRFGFTLGLAL